MSWRDEEDMTQDVASASEMTSRDEREASLFDDYEDPSMPAPLTIAERPTITPLCARFAALPDDIEYGKVPALIALPTSNAERVA